MLKIKTVVFKSVGGCYLCADIYHSKQNEGTILYLHSGALIWGSRKSVVREQINMYLDAGFNLVSVDYRLAPETKLDEIVKDVKDAITWIDASASRTGLDTKSLFVVGSSAGGYLALMTGSFQRIKPTAIVSFYGYGDIVADWYCKPSKFYCQSPAVKREEAYELVGNVPLSNGARERFKYYLYLRQNGLWTEEVSGHLPANIESLGRFCPLRIAGTDFPPTMLLHGDEDTDVPYSQSVQMYEQLKQLGVESHMVSMKGKGHVFDRDMTDYDVRSALNRVIYFLRCH